MSLVGNPSMPLDLKEANQLVQEANFIPNQVSSHLDFIYPFKLANKPKMLVMCSK